eukprot:m.90377 g.90377  ORF g.90377 m.90377 type:complete len:103 (-) comp8850_c1_seq17:859-1167(-)
MMNVIVKQKMKPPSQTSIVTSHKQTWFRKIAPSYNSHMACSESISSILSKPGKRNTLIGACSIDLKLIPNAGYEESDCNTKPSFVCNSTSRSLQNEECGSCI